MDIQNQSITRWQTLKITGPRLWPEKHPRLRRVPRISLMSAGCGKMARNFLFWADGEGDLDLLIFTRGCYMIQFAGTAIKVFS